MCTLIFVKIISIYYFWWIGRLFKKKKKSKPYILFTMILSTISCLFPFRKKDVERSARCFRFQYPLRREISNSATSHRETFKLRPRSDWYYATMYLHRSHAPMASCRVGSHRSTTLEDESISFRTKRLSSNRQTDSRAKGVAFCRRWHSLLYCWYFIPDTASTIPFPIFSGEKHRWGYVQLHTSEDRLRYAIYIRGYIERINYQSGWHWHVFRAMLCGRKVIFY